MNTNPSDDRNNPDHPDNPNNSPEYIAYCEAQLAEAQASGDDLAEDYPGQHITGPDFDTRDREGR